MKMRKKSLREQWPVPQKGIAVFSYPEDQSIQKNEEACFTVVAEPVNPRAKLKFQWQKNGINIPKATGHRYVIRHVQVEDVGFFSCQLDAGKGTIAVRSVDESAPGARLFVLTGIKTAVSGPVQPGTGTKSVVGPYTGHVTFKNASNSTWFTPPAGTTKCTIRDTSCQNYSPPYTPVVEAVDNFTLNNWCATNAPLTFNVSSGHKYQFTTYIKNTMPPPRSGDTLTLDIQWQP